MVALLHLRALGVPDPRALVLSAASYGMVKFPEPVVEPPRTGKRKYHHWNSVKERTDYKNLMAKIRRARE